MVAKGAESSSGVITSAAIVPIRRFTAIRALIGLENNVGKSGKVEHHQGFF
jgi:hypothetical protein